MDVLSFRQRALKILFADGSNARHIVCPLDTFIVRSSLKKISLIVRRFALPTVSIAIVSSTKAD